VTNAKKSAAGNKKCSGRAEFYRAALVEVFPELQEG